MVRKLGKFVAKEVCAEYEVKVDKLNSCGPLKCMKMSPSTHFVQEKIKK